MRQDLRIIVEGMDGSGKTTLVDHLMDRFPGQLELIVNKKGPDQDFNTWWPEQFDREKGPLVPLHDRFFYSELVYGPVVRGHITAEDQLVANGIWFLRAASYLIYARPHSDRLREGVTKKPQMEGVHHKFNDLLSGYDQLMELESSWYGTRFQQYVWHRDGELERITAAVEKYLAGNTR